jgi:[protein-PII] uridylyltransferase
VFGIVVPALAAGRETDHTTIRAELEADLFAVLPAPPPPPKPAEQAG